MSIFSNSGLFNKIIYEDRKKVLVNNLSPLWQLLATVFTDFGIFLPNYPFSIVFSTPTPLVTEAQKHLNLHF